jgi:putative membrane protein
LPDARPQTETQFEGFPTAEADHDKKILTGCGIACIKVSSWSEDHCMNLAVPPPDQNVLLALRRNFLAAERTLMAWIRTSISMIGFGFTLAKLFQSLAERNVLVRGPGGRIWTAESVGVALISLGTFALIVAVFDHHRELKQLRACGLEARFSLTMAVASVLAILGTAALISLAVSY